MCKNELLILAFIFNMLYCHINTSGQDIVLHRPYRLSSVPNYALSDPNYEVALTDGIFTDIAHGNFWGQKSAIGWQNKQQIIITLDLGKTQNIGSVVYSTVRKTQAGVDYPSHVFVFISKDGQNFSYAGDVVNDIMNTPGTYMVRKFRLNDIDSEGRYVILYVIPTSKLTFCDEIEIYPGLKASSYDIGTIKKSNLSDNVDSLINEEFIEKWMRETVNTMMNLYNGQSAGKELQKIASELSIRGRGFMNIKAIDSSLNRVNVNILREKYNGDFIIQRFNPWDSLTPFYKSITSSSDSDYRYLIPCDGMQYGAFVLTNLNYSDKEFTIRVNNSNHRISDIDIFDVPFVNSKDHQMIADPLVPLNKGRITVNPGNSRLFIFKMRGQENGLDKASIIITSSRERVALNVSIQVVQIAGFAKFALNTNVWAYLNYPLIKNMPWKVAKDLEFHHINTIVIPPAVLPKFANKNFEALITYLKHFDHIQNILLFTNYVNKRYTDNVFLDSAWKRSFIIWYQSIMTLIKEHGFSNASIYLYPYDEISDKDVNNFRNLISWSKRAVPGIKYYATINSKMAADNILPLVDVAQVRPPTNLSGIAGKQRTEIWYYNMRSPARSLSPYAFYRLMAWYAFLKGYTGIGFWNYASEGTSNQLNLITTPLMNPLISYSVIYNGPGNSVISTRRWEAFSLGIEDYQILYLYAKKFGYNSTIKYVQEVLNNSENLNLADSIKTKMISSLSD